MRGAREAADLDSQHGGLLGSAVGAGGPHGGSTLVQLHTPQSKHSRMFSNLSAALSNCTNTEVDHFHVLAARHSSIDACAGDNRRPPQEEEVTRTTRLPSPCSTSLASPLGDLRVWPALRVPPAATSVTS